MEQLNISVFIDRANPPSPNEITPILVAAYEKAVAGNE